MTWYRSHAERSSGAGVRASQESTPLEPDIQRDLRLDMLYDEQTEREALEHFADLRRDAEERAG